MPDTQQSTQLVWTWGSVLSLAFTTGLVTAVFNQGFALLKESWQERRKHRLAGRALALELLPILTAFAQECSDRLGWNEYEKDAGSHGRYTAMPVLRDYPADAKWETLRPDLAAQIRYLPNQRDQAVRSVSIDAEINGPEDEIDAATCQYAALGHEALTLIRRLHRYARLGPVPRSPWVTVLLKARRKYHQGPISRLWHSWPVYRVRSFCRLFPKRVLRTLGLRSQSFPRGFFE